MSVLFISDLHLSPHYSELIHTTCEFLKRCPPDVKSLYILGDLFNTWLGDDIVPTEFDPIIDALKQLSERGVDTYIMVGNRDFMLGQSFAKRAGSILISEPKIIDLYGYKTLLLHGDSLCIDDVSYQKYRRWTRIKILQWLFLALPAKYRQRISDQIKQKSREQKQYKSAQIMDVNQSEVIRVMNTYDVQVLIHGHTHRPYIHQLNLEENQKTRIVLGDWDSGEPSYLKCSEHGFELVDHRIISSN